MTTGRRYFFKTRRRNVAAIPAVLLGMLLLLASAGVAEGAAGPETACLDQIRAAERDVRLPGRLLLAIGMTEAGRRLDGRLTVWPWTVNAEGKGRFFADKSSAVRFVETLRARGVRSIDVGCMQVNLHWHPQAFPDLETAFDPEANVAYAAGLLKRHHGDLRNWSRSVRRYHSATDSKGDAYFERVSDNLRMVMRRRHELADMPARKPIGSVPPPARTRKVDDAPGPGSAGTWRLPSSR